MKNHEGPWSHYLWQPRFCWFHQFDPWTNPEKYVKIPIWMSQIINKLRPSPPFSAATRPRWTVSATGPVSGTSRLRSTPRWRATRQVYRRGSYLTKTKVDKISGDFPRFCQLYFSSFRSFRTNMILLSAWCCLLLLSGYFHVASYRDSCACRWELDRSSGICHVCTDVGLKGQDCQMAFSDVIGGIRAFLRKSHVFFVAKYETSAASLFPINNVGQTQMFAYYSTSPFIMVGLLAPKLLLRELNITSQKRWKLMQTAYILGKSPLFDEWKPPCLVMSWQFRVFFASKLSRFWTSFNPCGSPLP